jgi:DNA-binding beta-propeller fold protein YncE
MLSQGLTVMMCLLISGCDTTPAPDGIFIELAPDLISSAEGTMRVRALVVGEQRSLSGESVRFDVAYTDRNGDEHVIEAVTGETDKRGSFETVLSGFDFEGMGSVSATLVDDEQVSAEAVFSVLDETPPTVLIQPPTADSVIGTGFPLEVIVDVADEIGIGDVQVEVTGELVQQVSTVVASGEKTATVRFDFEVPQNAAAGPSITLHATAVDLSGNITAAEPVVVTVDPALEIAVGAGLTGSLLSTGVENVFLDDPSALAVSPMDGKIYVADNSTNNPCAGGCIRIVDAATGVVEPNDLLQANDRMEGIAFSASGDKLYYSDHESRVVELSWDAGAISYNSPVSCVDVGQQNPREPFHLIHDATVGLLIADQRDNVVKVQDTCDGTQPDDFTTGMLDRPHGISSGGAGEFYVSDRGLDRVYSMDDQGVLTLFGEPFENPRGIVWTAGGTSEFADSLLVTERTRGAVSSTRGEGKRSVASTSVEPVDVEVVGDTLYILTEPVGNNGLGYIFVVTGL